MADSTITADDIQPGNWTRRKTLLAGEAVAAGEMVYIKAADGKFWLAGKGTLAAAQAYGMAANTAATNQLLSAVKDQDVTVKSGEAAAGDYYFLSASGKITSAEGDITSGQFKTGIGYGKNTTTIHIDIVTTQTAVA